MSAENKSNNPLVGKTRRQLGSTSPSKPSDPVNVSPLNGFFIFLGVIGFFILFVIAQVYGNSTVSILLAVLVAIPLIIIVIVFIYKNGTLKDFIWIGFREMDFRWAKSNGLCKPSTPFLADKKVKGHNAWWSAGWVFLVAFIIIDRVFFPGRGWFQFIVGVVVAAILSSIWFSFNRNKVWNNGRDARKVRRTILFTLVIIAAILNVLNWGGSKIGTTAYLDSKNGIGGISFGSNVAMFKERGFVYDGNFYTNYAFQITFGDFYLDDIQLKFTSDRLVHIWGDVHFINQHTDNSPDNSDCLNALYNFLTVLFGGQTTTSTGKEGHAYEDDAGVHTYLTDVGPTFHWWVGNKITLVISDSSVPRLEIWDSREEKEVQANQQKAEDEKEKAEKERMLKQNF